MQHDTLTAHQQPPLVGSAAVACIGCRKLKMRCIGAENPPCSRCRKAGRECVVRPPRRGQQQQHRQRASLDGRSSATSRDATDDLYGSGSAHDRSEHFRAVSSTNSLDNGSPRHQSSSPYPGALAPCTTSTSPQLPRSGDNSAPVSASSWPYRSGESGVTRNSQGSHSASPGDHAPVSANSVVAAPESVEAGGHLYRNDSDDLPDDVLAELVLFFRGKILYYVPVIDRADLQDLPFLLKHRKPLVYCASLIASHFMPGGAAMKEKLAPHVTHFLTQLNGPLHPDQEVLWGQLQAFAILYAYRPSRSFFTISDPEPGVFVNDWVLKAILESFALRIGLHRALADVKISIRDGHADVAKTQSFREYTYWLWLFTMSHHFSLLTFTPPTISQDVDIKSACSILSQVCKPARITRILAEVDMCTLWDHANRHLPGLSEWWCSPPEMLDLDLAVSVLSDAEGALEVWSKRWGLQGEPVATIPGLDLARNGAVDYHFRGARFFISAFCLRMVNGTTGPSTSPPSSASYVPPFTDRYGANSINSPANSSSISQPDAINESSFEALNANLTLKSAKAAEYCCRYLVDQSPRRLDIARYMADAGFGLISFCGAFLICVFRLFGSVYPVLGEYLITVEKTGKLLLEMSVGCSRAPMLFGRRLLALLNSLPASPPDSADPSVRESRVGGSCKISEPWVESVLDETAAAIRQLGDGDTAVIR